MHKSQCWCRGHAASWLKPEVIWSVCHSSSSEDALHAILGKEYTAFRAWQQSKQEEEPAKQERAERKRNRAESQNVALEAGTTRLHAHGTARIVLCNPVC